PTSDAGAPPRRSAEVEDVLRLAAARAAHTGRAAGVDDIAQVLGEVGSDLPGADLVVRHFPRVARDFWGSVAPPQAAPDAATPLVDLGEGDSQLTLAGTTPPATSPAPAVDQALMQRVFERLADMERGFADRLAALEAAVARQSSAASYTDLSP